MAASAPVTQQELEEQLRELAAREGDDFRALSRRVVREKLAAHMKLPDLDEHRAIIKFILQKQMSSAAAHEPASAAEEQGVYTVEAIVGSRARAGKKEYRVRWEGYTDIAWEPAGSLANASKAVSSYEKAEAAKQQQQQKKKSRKPDDEDPKPRKTRKMPAAAAAAKLPQQQQKKRGRSSGWSEPLVEVERALAATEDVADLAAAEKALTTMLATVKRSRMEMGGDALLEKMLAATSAGKDGEPSKADTRKLLAVLRGGKYEARCTFSEAGSSVGGNRVEIELDGCFAMGSKEYGISGAVTDQEGDQRMSREVHIEGIGYFCEDDGMQCDADRLGDDNDALQWAEEAGVEMTEGQVIRIIVIGLSVMLEEGQTGDAKDSSYGIDPVERIFEWVQEAMWGKFPSGSSEMGDNM